MAKNLPENYPPVGYVTPRWPGLHWPPQDKTWSLYYLSDMWRFTVLWTLILYAAFHWGAAAIAVVMQVGKKKSNWKYVWIVPIAYTIIAGVEAICAGCVTGAIVGVVYRTGGWAMPTWIPFIWGWANVLVLLVSSFSIQGGL